MSKPPPSRSTVAASSASSQAVDSAGGRPGPSLWVAQWNAPDAPREIFDGALLRPSSASLLLQPCAPGETRRLLLGPRCVVGRSKGDITFPHDKCVSRQHAAFIISSVSSSSSHLGIIDTRSSTGVSVGGKRIPPGVEVRLRSGARVQFGLGGSGNLPAGAGSGVTVLETRLRVCLSRVDRQERARIAEALSFALSPPPPVVPPVEAGAGTQTQESRDHAQQQQQQQPSQWWFVEDVRRCDVLVCHALSATTKVLAALVLRVPIVTPAWVYDLRDRVASMRAAAASPETPSSSYPSLSGEALHSLGLPLDYDRYFPSLGAGMQLHQQQLPHNAPAPASVSPWGVPRARLLEGLAVVLFLPKNEVYASILEGCGAAVIRDYESSMVPAPARTVGARAARQLDEALAAAASNGVVFLESVADLSKEVLRLARARSLRFLDPPALAAAVVFAGGDGGLELKTYGQLYGSLQQQHSAYTASSQQPLEGEPGAGSQQVQQVQQVQLLLGLGAGSTSTARTAASADTLPLRKEAQAVLPAAALKSPLNLLRQHQLGGSSSSGPLCSEGAVLSGPGDVPKTGASVAKVAGKDEGRDNESTRHLNGSCSSSKGGGDSGGTIDEDEEFEVVPPASSSSSASVSSRSSRGSSSGSSSDSGVGKAMAHSGLDSDNKLGISSTGSGSTNTNNTSAIGVGTRNVAPMAGLNVALPTTATNTAAPNIPTAITTSSGSVPTSAYGSSWALTAGWEGEEGEGYEAARTSRPPLVSPAYANSDASSFLRAPPAASLLPGATSSSSTSIRTSSSYGCIPGSSTPPAVAAAAVLPVAVGVPGTEPPSHRPSSRGAVSSNSSSGMEAPAGAEDWIDARARSQTLTYSVSALSSSTLPGRDQSKEGDDIERVEKQAGLCLPAPVIERPLISSSYSHLAEATSASVSSFLSQAARLASHVVLLPSTPRQSQSQLVAPHPQRTSGLNSSTSLSPPSSGQLTAPDAGSAAMVRNVKRFRKNSTPSSRAPTSVLVVPGHSSSHSCVLTLASMDRVLPRETERQMQMRLEAETLQPTYRLPPAAYGSSSSGTTTTTTTTTTTSGGGSSSSHECRSKDIDGEDRAFPMAKRQRRMEAC